MISKHFTNISLVMFFVSLPVYLMVSIVYDTHGWKKHTQLMSEKRQLLYMLEIIQFLNTSIERDVQALQNKKQLDTDLLDQKAREILGYSEEGEIVAVYTEAEILHYLEMRSQNNNINQNRGKETKNDRNK